MPFEEIGGKLRYVSDPTLLFFVRRDGLPWQQVSKADYVSAESSRGFRSKFGPTEPATGSFSSGNVSGLSVSPEHHSPEHYDHDAELQAVVNRAVQVHRASHPS